MSVAESGPPRCPAPAWWMACTISLRASALLRRSSSSEGRVLVAIISDTPRLRQRRDHRPIRLCRQPGDVRSGGREEEGGEAAELDRFAIATDRDRLARLGRDLLLAQACCLRAAGVERADAVGVE